MADPFAALPPNQPFVVSTLDPAQVMRDRMPKPEELPSGDERDHDPGRDIAGMPPNAGQDILPHVFSFQGLVRTAARVYSVSDEAMQNAWDNAASMRNCLGVMECLEQRQRSTALLGWHLEPEDRKSPQQKQLVADLTAVLNATPNFLKLRECLLEALWYGKYGVQSRFRWDYLGGVRRLRIERWRPVNGDKIVFRFDDGWGEHQEDQVGIRVGAGATAGQKWAGRWNVERVNKVMATDQGLAYFLEHWQRPLLAIHKHKIEDAEFESPRNAGRVHGVGIRSRIYWEWYQSQEALGWLMDFLERTALGYEVWGYPAGNPEAEKKVKEAARDRIAEGRNLIFVPVYPDNSSLSADRLMRRIEPGMGGAEALQRILTDYWGHRIKRYILGQTLTSEAASTGLGSGVASIHLDTYLQIIRYDAMNLEESLTEEIVRPLLLWNFPKWAGCPIRFKIESESPDIAGKLAAWKDAFEMGLGLKAGDLYELIGAAQPGPEDTIVQQQAQSPQGGPGGQGPGGPGPGDAESDLAAMMRQLGMMQRYRRRSHRKLPQRYRASHANGHGKAGKAGQDGDRDDDGDHKDGWKTLGGGAHVAIKDGKIVAGCPGLKTEDVEDLGEDEPPENRQKREHRQDVAEHHDLKGEDLSHRQVKQLEDHPHPETGKDAEGKPAEAAATYREPSQDAPATIRIGQNQLQVARRNGVWFFRRPAASGWTAATPESALIIEKALPGRPVSAEEVITRIASSPNQPQDADWQQYAERWGVQGGFHTAVLPVETLRKLSAAGWLRMSRHTDAGTVRSKAESGKLNPVILTREPGKGLVVLDGTHSLLAAHERGDEDVRAIVSDEAAPLVKDPGGLPDDRPFKYDPKRGAFLRKEPRESSRARIQRAIAATAQDHGVDPQSLSEALDFLYQEKAQHAQAQEQAAVYARQSTGLSAGDIARLENQGHDYASAHKVGGATGAKFRNFEVAAEQVAHQYPELGWRDSDDLAANLWSLLRHGSQPMPAKDDPDLLRDAANLVLVNRAGAGGAPEWDESEEVIPFARRGQVQRYRRWHAQRTALAGQLAREFQARGWPERYAGKFDPDKHPRGQPENAGRFCEKGGGQGTKDGGKEPNRDDDEHRKMAKAKIGQHLAEATYLTEAQRALYRTSAHAVIDAMGPEALRRWNESVSRVKFHATTTTITELYRRRNPRAPKNRLVRGLCIPSRQNAEKCELHLNGGLESGQSRDFATREIYSHEFAHAVDYVPGGKNRYSSRPEWLRAWNAENGRLDGLVNVAAKADLHEAFAEFGRLAWMHGADAKRRCPQCWQFWSQEGLV